MINDDFNTSFRAWFDEQTQRPFIRKMLKVFLAPVFYPVYVFYERRRIIFNKLDLHILSKCSLNCKYCSTMMPFFKEPAVFPKEEILRDFWQLEKYVDRFDTVNLLGGEPLLHPDLPDIISEIALSSKVKKITVVTNGTLFPSEKLLSVFAGKKIFVVVSNYFPLSGEINNILSQFRKDNISFSVATSWFNDYGRNGRLNRSEEDMKYAFSHCLETLCRTYLHGKLYLCPASAQMDVLGMCKPAPEDFIDIREVRERGLPRKTVRERLKKLLRERTYVSACNYCEGHYRDQAIRKSAEQLPPNRYIDPTDFSANNRE